MSLINLHMRRLLQQQVINAVNEWSIDTLPEDYSAPLYLVRRESDNATSTFSRNDLYNGTYETWLNGSVGRVKEWYGGVQANQPTAGEDMQLWPNNDYLGDKTSFRAIGGNQPYEMDGDFVATLVSEREDNANNQRCSLTIAGGNGRRFTVDLRSNGNVYINFNVAQGSTDILYVISNTYAFKLLTFYRINGVFNMMLNNNLLTDQGTSSWSVFSYVNDYEFALGGRSIDLPGKLNLYKHVGLVSGTDLSTFDISTYNQAIMDKYGIT